MEIIIKIITGLLGIVIGLFISNYFSLYFNSKKLKRFNTNYLCADKKLFDIKFKVIKIEKVLTKNAEKFVAKYYIKNLYLVEKDDIEVTNYYFYDEIGKYNIDDELYFAKY